MVNDHKIALKLALSEFGALGMGKKVAQSSKPTTTNTERAGPKGNGAQTCHITIPIKGNYVKREPPMKHLSIANLGHNSIKDFVSAVTNYTRTVTSVRCGITEN